MSLVYVVGKAKSLFLVLLTVLKRALCCFRKRRRTSHCDSEILTTIGIVPSYGNTADVKNKPEEENWTTWEDQPVTIQDHIDRYRQQRNVMKEAAPEPVPDYFQDMTPRLTRQPKVIIQTQTNVPTSPMSRLAVNSDIPITSELETWDEDQNGWEDDSENAMELLREKRRQERREQLKQGQTKKFEQRVPSLGTKRSGA